MQTLLLRLGFLNIEASDLSDMTGENQDVIATFCSSFSCQGGSVSKFGKLVATKKVSHCPRCNSKNHLRYDEISKTRARKFDEN